MRRILCLLSLAGLTSVAGAATITDISGGGQFTVNTAKFEQYNFGASGTGTLSPFLRLQGGGQSAGFEKGYNTDGTVEFDTKVDPHTHSLLLNSVPIASISGIDYYEFLLDTGEPGNDNKKHITIDDMQLFLFSTPNNTGFAGFGTPIYGLDSGGDVGVSFDGSFGNGNGTTDARIYVPKSPFDTYFVNNPGKNEANSYLYFYLSVSGSDGGFEEVAVRKITPRTPPPPPPPPVPLPSASVGGLTLLAALALRRHLRTV